MNCKSNLGAASIAEVVISLTIISICFGIAMLSIVGVRNNTIGFQEINDQTFVQNHILNEVVVGENINFEFDSEFSNLRIEINESENHLEKQYTLSTNSGRVILSKVNYLPLRNE